ncbi:hypothetical protein GOX01_20650 [Gluconobacter oxydans]|uniref:Abortive infection family protein n=1 Tax=Gluconobacter oxydans TaxID=442 RepID=A0AB35APN4_GLUOY|nr:abortive infection family protein [Gluconobacter oxydans]MBF0856990.1 abortive infection family protein [Gluconobacter oxydans]TCW23680.1 abortive infection Abi-like protein [Gluconobacter oxydans]GEC61734.1 hypothetical protein GOX01_20650 [Gluconobacter oxydans]
MNIPSNCKQIIACVLQGITPPGMTKPISGQFSVRHVSQFFEQFGGDGLYPQQDPSSSEVTEYIIEFLEEVNGTPEIDRLICAIPDFCASHEYRNDSPASIAFQINKILKPMRFRLKKNNSTLAGFSSSPFLLETIDADLVPVPTLTKPEEIIFINNVNKARERLDVADYSGAITSSYTLVESVLKKLLDSYGAQYAQGEGDIKALYGLLSDKMNLNPAGENIEGYIKAILQGIRGQISGLYNVANKAGDRHACEFEARRHHARLAVNVAFTISEFLMETYEDQLKSEERKAS